MATFSFLPDQPAGNPLSNHLTDLIAALLQPTNGGRQAVLVTVVQVEGSAYRKPSARMLIFEDGQTLGMVSGGCLERHLVQRAFWLTRQGAVLKTYQTADDTAQESEQGLDSEADTEQQGFGLGCNGTIRVLFERLTLPSSQTTTTAPTLLNCFIELQRTHKPQPLVTIIASNVPQLPVGSHFIPEVFKPLMADWTALPAVAAGRGSPNQLQTWHKGEQRLTVFYEVLRPPLHLVIFGAGLDSVPLVWLAQLQGWQVSVIDAKADRLAAFPVSTIKKKCLALEQAEQVQAEFARYPHTAVVIMTHSLSQDRQWLAQTLLSDTPPRYIGQLGPASRTERLISEIGQLPLDTAKQARLQAALARLHYPMGLTLGGDTPEAVALSIVAQIQQVIHQSASQ